MPDAAQVWVVDDDRSVRFVLAAALGEAGYRVTAFADAAEVLAALAVGRMPDLLLTDVRMPGDSGLVLLDKREGRASAAAGDRDRPLTPTWPAPPGRSAAARRNSCPSRSTWTMRWRWCAARCPSRQSNAPRCRQRRCPSRRRR